VSPPWGTEEEIDEEQVRGKINAEEATVETIQEDLQQRTAFSPPGVPGGTFEA
jgi:hypothetical protein